MSWSFMVVCLGFFLPTHVTSDEPPQVAAQREAMKKLESWVGEWEGTGWFQDGPNQRREFNIHESIQRRLEGLALVVEGKGRPKGEENAKGFPTHSALAVVTYDAKTQRYRFQYHRIGQDSGESELTMVKGGWEWKMALQPRGTLRFTFKIAENHWNEIGEFSPDGKGWFKFMEMNLERQNAKP